MPPVRNCGAPAWAASRLNVAQRAATGATASSSAGSAAIGPQQAPQPDLSTAGSWQGMAAASIVLPSGIVITCDAGCDRAPMAVASAAPWIGSASARSYSIRRRRKRRMPSVYQCAPCTRSISAASHACTVVDCSPSPAMPSRSVSPGLRKRWRPMPTPAGVPVAMRSPGSSVMKRLT